MHLPGFTEVDKLVLSRCSDLPRTRNRALFSLVVGLLLVAVLVVLRYKEISAAGFFWFAVIYTVITSFDKSAQVLTLLAHKRVIVKLVKHVVDRERAGGTAEGDPEAPGPEA